LHQCFQGLCPSPVQFQLKPVQLSPLLDQLLGTRRTDLAFHDPAVEVNERVLPMILRMKVRRRMVIKEHAYDDAKERRDDGHRKILSDTASETDSNGEFRLRVLTI